MCKLLAILVLLGANALAQQNNGDLNSILGEVFGKPPAPPSNDTNAALAAIFGPPTGTGQNTGGPAENKGGNEQNPVTESVVRPATIVPPPGFADITNDTSCVNDDGLEGECVRYFTCNPNNTVITDGSTIIDIRGGGACPQYLDVCCLLKDKRPPTDPILPPTPVTPLEPKGCGYRNPDGVVMRTTGDVDGESKFGEFPWMAAILKVELVNEAIPDGQKLNVYVGGGSLIHPSIVLTAAHYVTNVNQLRVRVGEWDTQTIKEIYPYQDRDVASVVVHKDFNKGNLFYDIALLFLETPVDPAPNVGLVCLPPSRAQVPPGTRCMASGWGKDKFEQEGRYQVILKKLELPVVSRPACQESLRKTRLGRFFELHTSFMCAGGEPGKDTCRGDGGSPLVCPIEFEPGRYMQSGIVAWGIGCGEDGTPGVYVDVANLRDWIDDKVKGKGYETNGYSYTV